MPTSFPTPPATFVGREDYVTRFRARLEHFRFFLYEGISGIGKTSLLLRLVQECKSLDMQGATYLPVLPGESVSSILLRLTCRLHGTGRLDIEHRGDPYVRLIELLESSKQVLILDALQNLKRDELPALIRACVRAKAGGYRVIGGVRGDPDLSAMDRNSVHVERVGALSGPEARQLATLCGLSGEPLELLVADVAHGGALGHPLTCRYLLALGAGKLPTAEFLPGQSARSVHAFKALIAAIGSQVPAPARAVIAALSHIGLPIAADVAQQALGPAFADTVAQGLLDVIDGDVSVHALVAQYVTPDAAYVSGEAAQTIATHLKERAGALGESLAVIRAAEVWAHAGFTETAVDSLATGWSWGQDPAFLHAYLKTLATIPAAGALVPRLKLLSAQARLQQSGPAAVANEVERLAAEDDPWTQRRALSALTYIFSSLRAHDKAIAAFAALQKLQPTPEELLTAGLPAVGALVQLDRLGEAHALAQELLPGLSGKGADEGELRQLLARILGQMGRQDEAMREAQAAVKCFTAAGDLYNEAITYNLIGDLYREAGDFEAARAATDKFLHAATHWGDVNLIQMAKLADAWIALDGGDVAHAAKHIAAVQLEVNHAPNRRLKRYVGVLVGLLEAGQGHHEKAVTALTLAVQDAEAAGDRPIVGRLRAQLIRSLIACAKLDEAYALVEHDMQGLDPKTHAPRLAALLRESALIRLRRRDPERAMQELAQASQLFAQSGNRREEAVTLHRIAHAALEEGQLDLAAEKAAEALQLATHINHARTRALATELNSRIALARDDYAQAETLAQESVQSLRRLGDELGVMHVSETLLKAKLCLGDIAGALRLGPKLRDHAESLGLTELRVRAVALTGVSLLRRDRLDLAARCFRPLPTQEFTAATRALMWRFGEALALAKKAEPEALKCRSRWIAALRSLPPARMGTCAHGLEQLGLAPRDRCELRTVAGVRRIGTEEAGVMDPKDYPLFIDVLHRRIYDGGKPVDIASREALKWVLRVAMAAPEPVPLESAQAALGNQVDVAIPALCTAHLRLKQDKRGVRLLLPDSYAFLVPVWLTAALSDSQKTILKLLRRSGASAMQTIQDECKLSRSAARNDVSELTRGKLVESIRAGRGQVYRLL